MKLKFISSSRGKPRLLHDNHLYLIDYKYKNTIRWKCEYFTPANRKCKCSIITDDKCENIIRISATENNHNASVTHIKVEKVKNKMRNMTEKGNDKPMQIITKCLNGTSDQTKTNLPNSRGLRQMIQNKRAQSENKPDEPRNLDEINIPDKYKIDSNGKSFFSRLRTWTKQILNVHNKKEYEIIKAK